MSESEGHSCPECGAPRGPDLSPSCDCTERVAEALRESRTAEAAAAEDFDPLRIRPYVKVEAGETTLPLRPSEEPPSTADPGVQRPEGARDGASTRDPAAIAPATARQPDDDPPRPDRRGARRTLLLSAAGALAAAGVAGGLLSYHTPSRDRSAQEVRTSVPQVSTARPASPTAPPASPAVPRSPVPPPAASASPPSPPSPTSPPATPTTSPTPSPSTATTRPVSPTFSATTRATPVGAPVLQRGDHGPEVTELQERLRQLNLYGAQINGKFTRPVEDAVRTYQLARGIQGDTLGVYGPATRESLEAETSEP
ncbi:peptidoglycan-binding domain-containing protein [Streptomyces sp. NPDC051917]|uniref:peptidoglycan-binding domain-containing protein n=1 Tax=Streptomyces sp. NPDC051917 TaxID=3154754 RepID=UPI0034505044